MSTLVKLGPNAFLQGKESFARGSTKAILTFLGVPFAAPPIGSLRFRPPETVVLWTGTREALKFGPVCPQDLKVTARTYYPYPMPTKEDEDCLFLNVWTPSLNPDRLLPVMVWFHGGAFIQGFSNYYDGTALSTFHDVIVVSVNYRVGPFGFLCLGEGRVRGNMGLLDQLEALRWVQRYIGCFGGDRDSVTVFGESAGSISIALHLVSPLAAGLFRRAICESGGSTHPTSTWSVAQGRKYALKRLAEMGCSETSESKILDFLAPLSGNSLVEPFGFGFNPVLDGVYLLESATDLLNQGRFNPGIDLMAGFNGHEGTQFVQLLAGYRPVDDLEKASEILAVVVGKMFFRGNKRVEEIQRRVFDFYLKRRKDETADKEGLMKSLVDLYGDLLFVAPTVELLTKISGSRQAESSSTYMYKFRYRPSFSAFPEWVTADHGQEIPFVFGEAYLDRLPDVWSDEDKIVIRRIMSYWTNFAKTGSPNGVGSNDGLPLWPKFDSMSKKYLVLDGTSEVRANFEPERVAFWNEEMAKMKEEVKDGKPLSKY